MDWTIFCAISCIFSFPILSQSSSSSCFVWCLWGSAHIIVQNTLHHFTQFLSFFFGLVIYTMHVSFEALKSSSGEWRNITWLNKIGPIRFHAKRAFQWYMVCLYCADPCVVSITWVIQLILMCFWVFFCSYGCCKNAVWYRRSEIQYYMCMCHNVLN